MESEAYLAADLGASGGRVLAGVFDGNRFGLEELYRFDNRAVHAAGGVYWNLLGLWENLCQGLRAAAATYPGRVRSVGVDTWGVDFAFLGRGDVLLSNPHSYRDPRTDGMMELACAKVGRGEIFAQTGLQFMQFNTLYQLLSLREQRSPLLEMAESLLMMPDLFHWLLTGVKANEFTNATTTQFYNPKKGTWAIELLSQLDIPTRFLGTIVPPGTSLGRILPAVANDTGLAGVGVVAPGTHDTASAVMAVPAQGGSSDRPNWCYLSSGTWSLMGVETLQPVINDDCLRLNFTNEGGVGSTNRLLKNISGLWLVQECRRAFEQAGHDIDWNDLTRMAALAPPHVSIIDPDADAFRAPTDMPSTIRAFCARTGQASPADEGALIRCCLESLALKCRFVLERLERLYGGQIETIHIVGGGVNNRMLCQMTADACRRSVAAGPVEATAIGNLLMQAIAAGELASVEQARELVRNSFPLTWYEPREHESWQSAYERLVPLLRARD